MLAITETAAQAITTLVAAHEMPQGAGLRISAQPDIEADALELSVVPAPSEEDSVLVGGGATIFLEPVAAEALDDKVLDVETVNEDGTEQLRFAIASQS